MPFDTILVPATYATYLLISISLTIWVARTLHKNGRAFLVDAMRGNSTLADSINHLLVVGFYLVNIGFVCLMLKMTNPPSTIATAIEALSIKLGIVLLSLGAMHFANILVFSKWREHAKASERPAWSPPPFTPPVAPGHFTPPAS